MANNRTRQVLRSSALDILYEGFHASYREALEQALLDNVRLDGLNAKGRNLRCANLDSMVLSDGNFENCDLSGANISEGSLTDCNFDEATLFDGCLCYTDFVNCHFMNTRFGCTDFSQASIKGCMFSGIPLFSVNLFHVSFLHENIYLHDDNALKMSSPPIIIHGLKNTLALFDDKMLMGSDLYDRPQINIPVIVEIKC